jgi:phosphotransferase system HPr-like phosphotransfer protein
VLGLGVKKGDELTVEVCGSDSDEALRAIQEIAENNFSDN